MRLGTKGEVSARSTDSQMAGQSFLMATLDVLPSPVAILDSQGTILAANAAWHSDTAFPGGRSLEGINYLDTCASIVDPAARACHNGVREVVDHKRLSFQHEYPCHRPGELRWYSVRAQALPDYPDFTVVSHQNITSRVMAERQLAQERARRADEAPGPVRTQGAGCESRRNHVGC